MSDTKALTCHYNPVCDLLTEVAALRADLARLRERRFPVHTPPPGCPGSVPWSFVAPYDQQARANHDQSLERLAERGGLSPSEMHAIVHGLRLRDAIAEAPAAAWLTERVDEHARLRADLARAEGAEARVEELLERPDWRARAEAAERDAQHKQSVIDALDHRVNEYRIAKEQAIRERDAAIARVEAAEQKVREYERACQHDCEGGG